MDVDPDRRRTDMSERYPPNEPTPPVSLELLALLLRSPDERVAETVRELEPLTGRPLRPTAWVARICVGSRS